MSYKEIIKSALLLTLWWLPRIFCILYIIILSFFSFSIFGQGLESWKTVLLFIAHNIPSILIIVILILSWKRSWLGGVALTLLGIVLFLWQPGRSNFLFSLVPMVGIGMLFFLNWSLRGKIKRAKEG